MRYPGMFACVYIDLLDFSVKMRRESNAVVRISLDGRKQNNTIRLLTRFTRNRVIGIVFRCANYNYGHGGSRPLHILGTTLVLALAIVAIAAYSNARPFNARAETRSVARRAIIEIRHALFVRVVAAD